MWSVGIILAEIVLREPPFKGKTELEQLDAIFRAIGSPEDSWPEAKMMKNFIFIQGRKHQHDDRLAEMIPKGEYGLSPEGVDLLKLLLTINPKKRITAKKALQHPWFKDTICLREDMLRHNPINEIERVKKRLKPNE